MSIFKHFSLVLIIICIESCSRVRSGGPYETYGPNGNAAKMIDFPLVNSVTNVYFCENVGGLQFLDRFIRFDLSNSDIRGQVELIVSDNNKKFNRMLPYVETNLASSEVVMPIGKSNGVSWWNPGKIQNGYFVGENRSYAVQIWVDSDRGTIFVHQGD